MARPNPSKSSVRRQVLQRISSRLFIVSLAVVAFFALSSLESLKSNYQRDRDAPLVIGEFGNNAQSNGSASGHVIPLEYRELTRHLEQVLFPSKVEPAAANDLKRIHDDLTTKKYPEQIIPSLTAAAERMRDRVLASVSRPATVTNESALIAAFAEGIDAANTLEQKSYSDARDLRVANYKKLAEKSPNQPAVFLEHLEQLGDRDKGYSLVESLKVRMKDAANITVAELVETANDVEQRNLAEIGTALNGFAQANYGRVYSATRMRGLSEYIAQRREAAISHNYFSARVLDDRHGEYALYQAVYITCIVLLVFGLLYPVYLLVRLLPPFAASLEPLTDQAKQIISGRRDIRDASLGLAAPAIAKTLALSVAAVGIGTAVAVANNRSSGQGGSADTSAIERELILNPRVKDWLEKGPPSPTPMLEDPRIAALEIRLDQLVTQLGSLGNNPTDPTLIENLARLKAEYEDLNRSRITLAEQVTDLNRRTNQIDFHDLYARTKDIRATDVPLLQEIPLIKRDTEQLLKTDIPKLNSDLRDFTTKADLVERTLFSKLDASAARLDTANNQILGARFSDEGVGRGNLFSKARQLFAGSRHIVTYQSYRIMENLICEQPVGLSRALDVSTCSNEQNRLLLANMKKEIGKAPVGEDKLLANLGATTSPWKNQLLRYTRSPN